MSLMHYCDKLSEEAEEIRRTQGDAAAERYYNRNAASVFRISKGGLTGATVGNAIVPGLGAFVGGIIGILVSGATEKDI